MLEDNILLGPLLKDSSSLKKEAASRRRLFDFRPTPHSEVQKFLADGWQVDKPLKTKIRLKKFRSADVRLENRVWLLFFLLGYHELNAGRGFTIRIERKGAAPLEKQIDVFAKDSETVIVAECKASDRLKRRSLQKDIEEFANLKGHLANTIKRYYGKDFKPKIIWLFVTKNIIWSAPDKERALGEKIGIITDRELRYYMQIADHLRGAARFQFLAEFLKDQKIPALQDLQLPAIRGTLGPHEFYAFVTTPRQLLKISFVNHRSLNDPDGAPTYQRLVSRSRLRQIGKFLSGGGFFPTNILVNFTEKVRFDIVQTIPEAGISFGHLYMPSRYRSAWIIDGQHRLYGFAPFKGQLLDSNIIVVAFVALTKEQEADLFVTINHEQKSVPKTLLDDLEGDLKWGSNVPTQRIGAVSARLINILNNDIGEPLYRRVTRQGILSTDTTCLTVPALKDGLRRSGLIGHAILKGKEFQPGPLSGISDSASLERARSALNQYFGLLRSSNPDQWEAGRKGFLCTNVALQAHLNFLASVISYMEANKGLTARELTENELISEIEEYLDPLLRCLAAADSAQMERHFKVQFGSGGPPEYYFRLCRILKAEFSDFEPEGMSDWEQEQSEERIEAADRKLKEINIWVQKTIFDRFKTVYGTDNDAYWNKGVPDKTIRANAYKVSLDDDDDDRLPLENYLNFIDYKKIVENSKHWNLFKPVFDIPEPGEKGLSKNVRWMIRINELRRIPAHPTESRRYKVEDFEYIDFVHDELADRLAGVVRSEK